MERFKRHIRDNKDRYIVGGLSFLAGITVIIMRGRYAGMQSVPDGLARVTMRPFMFFSDGNSFVSTIEREGRGHPGYVVQNLETGAIFNTQADAARAFNVSPSCLSSHLTGKFDNVNGLHFERVNVANLLG